MAFERPKKGSNNRVNDFDEPLRVPPIQTEPPRGFFSEDYNSMHSGFFAKPPGAKREANGIQGPMGCSLDVLVAKLATLQFTVKGKVGEDGKFELVFCSPEPMVQVVPPMQESKVREVQFAEPIKPEIRYIEAPVHRSDRKSDRNRRKGRSLF